MTHEPHATVYARGLRVVSGRFRSHLRKHCGSARAFRFNKAPNPWLSPDPREEAGYCLQFPGPMQIFDNLAERATDGIVGHWAHVRSWIVTALEAEGGAA